MNENQNSNLIISSESMDDLVKPEALNFESKGIAAWYHILATILVIIGVILCLQGFEKIDDGNSYHNRYVGGDAYNYIINGIYGAAYFALAGGLFVTAGVLSVGAIIINKIPNRHTIASFATLRKMQQHQDAALKTIVDKMYNVPSNNPPAANNATIQNGNVTPDNSVSSTPSNKYVDPDDFFGKPKHNDNIT